MTYSDEDLLPLSALQHYLFCQRQCALIHVERQWFENRFTAEGKVMHERVDREGEKKSGAVRIEYGLHLVCLELGLSGQADVVEFHKAGKFPDIGLPYPVEYKRGRPKKDDSDRVQLCAQALCLEEMYEVPVAEGALFYGKTRRRHVVMFDSEIRILTRKTIENLRAMVESRKTPEPVYGKKCDFCSFLDYCMPKVCGKKSIKSYLDKMKA